MPAECRPPTEVTTKARAPVFGPAPAPNRWGTPVWHAAGSPPTFA